ncbi:MAG: hydrogenase iron-sulfur subunit [Promethearchaeota archaeon]
MDKKQILIIGAGIAGIQAALNLAEMGEKVILLESNPSIGGRMAQLDKTFPTNDCSICILAPKMVEITRNPNINLFIYSELDEIERIEDYFRIKIWRKQRYVDENKCTGCGICSKNCPIEVPNEFDLNMRMRNAIYIPFPQAVPNVATIDKTTCIECKICETICEPKAINLNAASEGKHFEFTVYSILIATGFQLFDPSVITQFGYGRYANILTSLEYERLMCASGPSEGRIIRLADGKEPNSILFIQCVGSRSEKYQSYCSRICCMYATKEAIITKEHNSAIDITILYNDLRAYGKGFFEYTERAQQEYKLNYINAIPQLIEEDPVTKNLLVSFENLDSEQFEEKVVDLVILCPAIIPNDNTYDLAKKLGIKLNENGFFKSCNEFQSLETNIPGIYLIGTCSGPKDIPESVAEASGGALKVILQQKGKIELKILEERAQPEIALKSTPRIGVFVCHCGTNIGGVVNVPEVVEYVRTLPNVIYAQDTLYTCSEDSQVIIKEAIKDYKLNRVIVASCTPRTHEPLFRATCSEAGLNQYLFEMANIREQVSWVHMSVPEQATEKAKDIIRMAINRAIYLEPQEKIYKKVVPAALIIGGGIGGITAALNIANKEFRVYLVEKDPELGGLLKKIYILSQNHKLANDIIAPLIKQLNQEARIEIFLSTQIVDVSGSIGNFQITVDTKTEKKILNVGVIITAMGAEELKPEGLYGYGEYSQVKTLLEYEEILKEKQIKKNDTIVMILCAGAREQKDITYCSAICCLNALNNAVLTKEIFPDVEIIILYRDICVTGDDEKLFRKARVMGIHFIKYKRERKPTIERINKEIKINVNNVLNKKNITLEANWIVLVTPLIPPKDIKTISKLLKVPLSESGFFLEAHVKHRPLDFATDGIFVCGTCHSPKSISETINQANGAAARALIPLLNGIVESDALIAQVDSEKCVGCEICELNCPYNAAKIIEIEENIFKSEINPTICKGCGVCVAGCPTNAISLKNFEDIQINAMIKTGLENPDPNEPRIIVFLCNWCSYAGADNAGVSRFQYPTNIRPIRVMCSGRVAIHHIFNALLNGADGVLVTGCHIGDCHYISGNYKTERRVKLAKDLLKLAGINPRCLRLEWISASEGNKFAKVIKDFTEEIKSLRVEKKV